jgi:hypothetical protein
MLASLLVSVGLEGSTFGTTTELTKGVCGLVLRGTAGIFFLGFATGIDDASLLVPATGSDSPRNFPLLATPTPHVSCVLYPEQSLPWSRHCEQYGLRRSHCNARLLHVKQSAAAPAVGALFLRFLDGSFASAAMCGELIGGAVILVIFAIVAIDMSYVSSHVEIFSSDLDDVFQTPRRRSTRQHLILL